MHISPSLVRPNVLPYTVQRLFHNPPEEKGQEMEFRLVYEGPLAAAQTQSHVSQKHEIRRHLHPQMRSLWSENPFLRSLKESGYVEHVANEHKIASQMNNIFRFVPLVGERNGISCSLDILFLRRDMPGSFISNQGDIDNRLKVLFDALRLPKSTGELGRSEPETDEDPFFCLLEDDSYITQVKVTTDRLLKPLSADGDESAVFLVIRVKIAVFNFQNAFVPFLGS
jgi:hypothetical protein